MKAIILAGGSGSRLHPASAVMSKQLLPVYDKPMIYYPLSTVMLAGIRDILIITTPHDLPLFEKLLGDGSQWGISIQFATQDAPRGIAEAFVIGEKFIGSDSVCLMLGDNIIHGHDLSISLPKVVADLNHGATVFGYHVSDPERYGVVAFDNEKNVSDILEKPKNPPSNYAVIGLYFYDNQVVEIAKTMKPSARGELEITDINRAYLAKNQLRAELLGRGIAWLDTGTHDSLIDAAHFIQVLEHRQSLKVGCPEEIAWRKGFITSEKLRRLAEPLINSGYGKYLLALCNKDFHESN